jgi:hypothetical protein
MTADEIILDLHASEINGRIEWVYDGAWIAGIGDSLNGWQTEATPGSFAEAVEWLRAEAVRVMCSSSMHQSRKRSASAGA